MFSLVSLATLFDTVGRSVGPDWKISVTTEWIAMKLYTDIHGPQMMKSTDSGDPDPSSSATSRLTL